MTSSDLRRGNPEWATFSKNAKAAGIPRETARKLWKSPRDRARILNGDVPVSSSQADVENEVPGVIPPTPDQPNIGTSETPEDVEFKRVTQASQEEFDGAGAGGPVGSIQVDPLAWGFETIFYALGAVLNPVVDTPQGPMRVQVWAVHPKDAKRMARAWMAWVRSLPKRQRLALTKITNDIMPTITLIATFGSIVGARIDQTIKWRRGAGTARPGAPAPIITPPPPSSSSGAGAATNGDGRVGPGGGDPLDPAFLQELGFTEDAA